MRAVDDVPVAIEPGEMLALYGPSGSGKSTLLLLAAALLTSDKGTVHFDWSLHRSYDCGSVPAKSSD